MAFVKQADFSNETGIKKVQVPNKVLEEFANFFLTSRHWHDDQDMVERRVKKLRADIARVIEENAAKKKKSSEPAS